MRKALMIFVILCITMLINIVAFAETDGYILMGDVNNNELVNAEDALKILRIAAKRDDMDSSFSIRKNDFNNNYKIDADDALFILKIASKLEATKTIDDPENYYKDITYINGYPQGDFMSKSLAIGGPLTVENGELLYTSWRITSLEYVKGNSNTSGSVTTSYEDKGTTEIYNELKWLVEDAKNNNLLETQNITSMDYYNMIHGDEDYNAFFLRVFARGHGNTLMSISFYITDSNELYLFQQARYDLFTHDENLVLYKYIGEIPENLTYEAISSYRSRYSNQ